MGSFSDRATISARILHLYADGTSGNDTDDGLTAVTPKKTLQAVFDLVPDIIDYSVVIHLTGTFDFDSEQTVPEGLTVFGSEYYLHATDGYYSHGCVILDGGADLTTVAGAFTASSSDTMTLTDSGQAWTDDQYSGYMVEIVDGAAAGDVRTIVKSTGTSLYPSRAFSAAPGTCQFRVVRPTTLLKKTDYAFMSFRMAGEGRMGLQRLSVDAGQLVLGIHCTANVSAIVSLANTSGYGSLASRGTVSCYAYPMGGASYPYLELSDFDTTKVKCGFGSVNGKVTSQSAENKTNLLGFYDSFSRGLEFVNSVERVSRIENSRVLGAVKFDNVFSQGRPSGSYYTFRATGTGYFPTTVENPSGDGISCFNSEISLTAGVDISNCAGHGIVAIRSHVHLGGVVTGSGNTGAGLLLHTLSSAHIIDGSTPTLTGTVGDLSFDGVTENATWAGVDAGTPAVSATELSMCKEV
jgi:hypothetical protein